MAAPGGDIMQLFEGPSETSLDQRKADEVRVAKEAFKELEKLVKNIGLYGRLHSSTHRFRASLFSSLKAMLDGRDVVSIDIGPYEFTVHDVPIYENPNPEDNFIYKLYMDGVRHLEFLPGLTQPQIDDLLEVFLTNWADPSLFEDDMVTLMWQRHFEHIRYVVVDSFKEDIKEDEAFEYTVAGVVERVRSEVEASLMPIDEGGAVAGTDARRSAKVSRIGATLSERDLDNFEEMPFAMDEVEFETLGAMIATTGRETLEKFIEILFKVNLVEEASDAERARRVVGVFDRIADLLLEQGRLGDLERFMRKVRRLTGPDGVKIEANVAAIEHIFRHWTTPEFVEKVTGPLDAEEVPELPSVLAICTLLEPEAAVHLARRVGHIQNADARAQLLTKLPYIIRGQEQLVARLLREVEQQHAHDLFKVLRQVASPDDMLVAVRAALGSKEGGVRFEGLSALPNEFIGSHLEMLYKALGDPAKTVRSKALHMLARVRSEQVHAHILEAIDSKDFQAYALDEKRRYFAAAALTGKPNDRFLEVFASGGLLARKSQDEVRHCAAVALAIRLCADALPLFEKELKRRVKHELVAQACAWGLQHVTCDRDQRTQQLYDIFFRGELTVAPPTTGSLHG